MEEKEKRRKLQDYCEYKIDYNPGKSAHSRNDKWCIYDSFTYKLEDDGIPYTTVGPEGYSRSLWIGEMMKVNPVDMTVKFKGFKKVYTFRSRGNFYNAVKNNFLHGIGITEEICYGIAKQDYVFKFGKYKGMHIKDVDDQNYFKWITSKESFLDRSDKLMISAYIEK